MDRTSDLVQRRITRSLQRRGVNPSTTRKDVVAYVNHGRWVADCPCGGAELVTETLPMVCGSCGLTSPVLFPSDVADIERVLHDRKRLDVRNWYPGETVEMLEAENMTNMGVE